MSADAHAAFASGASQSRWSSQTEEAARIRRHNAPAAWEPRVEWVVMFKNPHTDDGEWHPWGDSPTLSLARQRMSDGRASYPHYTFAILKKTVTKEWVDDDAN